MADNTKEDFLQLVKRLGTFLSFRISTLVRSLDRRSFGAIAGLALAVVFTWKLIKTPRQSGGQSKRQNSSDSGSSGASTSSATLQVRDSHEDGRAQNVVDDFFQSSKLTLSQMVRQRLREGRKVTCCLLGVILEESTPEEVQKQATVRSSVLDVILEITKYYDLYLMERVLDDESERIIIAALEDAGFFAAGGLVKDKVLFCSTENGRMSFVRQLEPDWHIDSSSEIVTQLTRFIKYQLYISSSKLLRQPPNVSTATSLEEFFGSV
ncbi:hypothetical protein M569_03816 [Genlisea aurea]|uniref:Peroxisome biogenesis protein 22 n=1 Tax=Genlisea aurea TaxID=192259 RepID=S8CU85_9LAMI|nr:hypothetical protein M569_03816 [Genlisea aurea]